MSFSMKPQTVTMSDSNGGSDITEDQWKEWNDYLYSLTDAEEVAVEGKKGRFVKKHSAVGVLNFIMDMGFQPQKDSEYDTKCAVPEEGQENSEEELARIEKWPTNYFRWVDGKRKQYSPNRPEQEYAFFYDFPEIVVDWTKHPKEDMHKLGTKPLRISYNGRFGKTDSLVFNRTLPFRIDYKTKVLSSKNPIAKIANSSGVAKEFTDSGYDLGVLASSACMWEIEFGRNVSGDRTFYNTTLKGHSAILDVKVGGKVVATREDQIPTCDVEFVGVPLNDESFEYSEDTLGYIKNRKELIEVVGRATSFKPSPVNYPDFIIGVDYADTVLAKALGSKVEVKKEDASAPQEPAPQTTSSVSGDSFDDDPDQIPF